MPYKMALKKGKDELEDEQNMQKWERE